MKTAFTIFIICLFSISSSAQPGSLDKSFGDSGKVLTSFTNTYLQCFASAIQKDNKTVVVGEYDSASNNFFLNGFLVLRYLPNGDLDNGFGNNGKVIIDFGYDFQVAEAVAVQEDGKIVITGYSVSGLFDGNYDIPIARLNSDGSLDSSFGNNGKVITDFSDGDNASSICLQDDGKIVVGGYFDNVHFLLIRYKTNGSLDSTFGNKGKVINQLNGISGITSLAIQPDEKIIAGGYTDAGDSKFEIARYNSNGTPDSTFGKNGFVTTDYGANSDQVFKIIIQPDKKIVAVGGTGLNFDTKHEYIAVARYKSNGNLDSSYGIDGKSTLQYPKDRATGYAAAMQADNKLVIAGPLTTNTDEDYLLVRLKIDGSVDSSFGTNGSVITDFSGFYDEPWSVNIRSDNIIVVAGLSTSHDFNLNDVSLAAYNEHGKKQSIAIKIRHWLQHHNGIEWDYYSNINNYIVQRSGDGEHWLIVSSQRSTANSYYYNDPSPLNGTNYYRLQTTSNDGSVNYSNVIAVANSDITISPNPATNNLHIEGLSSNQKMKLTVLDFAGNIALSLELSALSSSYNLNITSLKPGNYLLKIETGDDVVTKKFVKE